MGDPRGFLKVGRRGGDYRPVEERVADYREVAVPRAEEHAREQASRCMDCGTPFCHWACPLGNVIPEWNDHLFAGRLAEAAALLDATNNLPEVTGRLCPALCEYACVLGLNDEAITCRENELSIAEQAFRAGLIVARPPASRTGKRVAVVGSGPAGLAAAQQLNRAGHLVTVFERDPKPGGILRYGIPDFKLEKRILDRRLALLEAEGIVFQTGVRVGLDYPADKLRVEFDAVCLAGGSRAPRDLPIEGRELRGIHFAMDYLTQSNRRVAGESIPADALIDARGKRVVVIGGGDTGADCVGTANRQGAASILQIEVLPQPPDCRTPQMPWPRYPMLMKTSTSHEEGAERQWAVLTKRFGGENGAVKGLVCARVDFPWDEAKKCAVMTEVPESVFEVGADLVILAVGFLHPEHGGLLADLGLEFDARGDVKTGADYQTSVPGIFSAGDMRRGQSLVVWAIQEGRAAAHHIDRRLMGESVLPPG